MGTKLEVIFQIKDGPERRQALVEYAKILKVNFLHAERTGGEYSENELAVLIYNAERARRKLRIFNVGFFWPACFILICLSAILFFLLSFFMPSVVP
ncbi:MAG TPA: hypothetical protein PLT76_02875 [Candidatus Omnitrophota bacterium]|nr:hypothetical protein [Candidatus Omnitrophota bacterium]HPB68765.1 hypothetical protein [Candidatus Omnitrophota bacterium]HQO57650.1 hypothetical protein [Candidatus Omnitrophota bacterium]HQP11838.1 hypothetical protein [Candidatus Omnitrophota bacterium]